MIVPRRSRMRRKSIGKRLALTDRDIALFRTLARYRYLRSTYLHAFVGGESEKRFKERLGDLFHEGYVDRPEEQWRFADARCKPVVHELGKRGAEMVGAEVETGAVTWLRDRPHRQFEHSLMICEVLASIELATRSRTSVRYIPWSEILAKAPEATRRSAQPYALSASNGDTVVPDAIFGLEYRRDGRKTYRFFALEADRGTMPIARSTKIGTSVLAKLETYRRILKQEVYRSRLGIPNMLILTITIGSNRCAELVRRFQETGDGVPFLFKAIDTGSASLSMPATALLVDPWQRAGLDALSIAA